MVQFVLCSDKGRQDKRIKKRKKMCRGNRMQRVVTDGNAFMMMTSTAQGGEGGTQKGRRNLVFIDEIRPSAQCLFLAALEYYPDLHYFAVAVHQAYCRTV